MGVEAMMTCGSITVRGNGLWLPACKAHEAARTWPPEERHTAPRPRGSAHECCDRCAALGLGEVFVPGPSSEEVVLTAVHSGSGNESWAAATPAGELSLTISNPDAWGFFEAGVDYRIVVTKRQPQKAQNAERDAA